AFAERPSADVIGAVRPARGQQTVLCGLSIVLLLGATALVYWPVLRHQFVNFDDGLYIYENGFVTRGISFAGLAWAWTNKVATVWHPLTWMAHMAVCEFGGTAP